MGDNMADRIYTIDELENVPLYELRLILREKGGVPGNKSVRELKEEIIALQSGKMMPTTSKRGRKPKKQQGDNLEISEDGIIAADLQSQSQSNNQFDEPDGDLPPIETYDDEYLDCETKFSTESYYEDGVHAPFRMTVCDVTADEPLKYVVASGVLEIMRDGYGFLRNIKYGEKRKDYYVERDIINVYALKTGDYIVGHAVNKYDKNSFSLCEVVKINGVSREAFVRGIDFEEGTAVYPKESLISDTEEDKTVRAIDLISPIAKGQRGLIVAPPKTGKTTLIKKLATAISNGDSNLHVMLLLIDERPEEVTEFKLLGIPCEIIASTFDKSPAHHLFHAELAIERAKRLVECGKDVVILMDSITKLARAYNAVLPSSGKTLSGGVELESLVRTKKIFGSARNLKEGGSLTILATTLIETGSRMDEVIFEEFKGTGNMEIVLSKELAQKRIFPAIDIIKSGTRNEELILSEYKLKAAWQIRSLFEVRNNVTETLLEMLRLSKNNEDLLHKIDAWIKAIRGNG